MSKTFVCTMCGEEKDEECFYDRPHGLSNICVECEQEIFEKLSEKTGAYIGLFASCCSLNVPFWCEKLPPMNEFLAIPDKWVFYNELIADEVHETDGGICGFFDGETNILRIFGKNLSKADVGEYVKISQQYRATHPGTREQRERWGTEPLCKGLNMTAEIYEELDRQYENWCGRYRGQAITPQLADSIVKICRWNLVTEHLIREGEYISAQKMQKMVDDLMASEQMRKKDEKPIEKFQFDACTAALERDGLMENKGFKSFDGTLEAIAEHFLTTKKYRYTGDVLDQVIADIYNNARINADMSPEDVLPAELKPHDDFAEFEEEAGEEEEAALRFAGATKIFYDSGEDEG